MAKISLNIPDDLDSIIREYAEKNNLTLTATCIELVKRGLSESAQEEELLITLNQKILALESDNQNLTEALAEEKKARIDDYKSLIAKNIETQKELLELMKADRVLALREKKEEKPTFFQKFKALFSSSENASKN